MVVSARHQILRREQQLFDGRGNAALQQHGLAHLAEFAQEVEILHVARAYLKDVDVGEHHRDLLNLHDLRHHQHAELVTGFAQQLQRFFSEHVKRMGSRARLERAAAEKLGARARDRFGHRKNLLARFYRARSCHDHHVGSANAHAAGKLDHSSFGPEGTRHQLVGRADAVHLAHARQNLNLADIELATRTDRAQHRLSLTRGTVHLKSHFDHALYHVFDLLFLPGVLHGDYL